MRGLTLPWKYATPFMVFALSSLMPLAVADSIIVPGAYANTPAAGQASAPFRGTANRFQEFYLADLFGSTATETIRIDTLRFRIDEVIPLGTPFSTVASGISITMSTTDRDFNSSSTTFSQNLGPDAIVVLPERDLALSGTKTSATSFDVVIPLPTRFEYNRKNGNLIVDIKIRGTSGTPFLDSGGGQFAVSGGFDSPTGTKVQALITAFEFAPVPEPRTTLLLLTGTLFFILRKKGRIDPH
jgi:hypothetical protein